MLKKLTVLASLILLSAYVVSQFDIKPARVGSIVDGEGNPIAGVDILYVVIDEYPNFGGSSPGDSECYQLKTDKNGSFVLPKTVRWSFYPLFFTEAHLRILGGANYGTEWIMPENPYSTYKFQDGGFNKPISLEKASDVEGKIKNLEDMTYFEYSMDWSIVFISCDKGATKTRLIDGIKKDYMRLLSEGVATSNKAAIYYNLGSIESTQKADSEEMWSKYLSFEPHRDIVENITKYEIFPNLLYRDFKSMVDWCLEGHEISCAPVKFHSKEYPEQ